MQAQRYFDILTYQNQFFPNKKALGHLKAGKEINFSSQKISQHVTSIACNLIDKGLKKGDYVCLFGPTTDAWWIMVELAISSVGAIVVPIEITQENLADTINHLRDTKAKFCFSFSQEIQLYIQDFEEQIPIPTLMVDGENDGIQHSYRVVNDAFASGDNALINHKTYYFIALAYAYNNYEEFDPNTGLSVYVGQPLAPQPRFDPNTGQPLAPQPGPNTGL